MTANRDKLTEAVRIIDQILRDAEGPAAAAGRRDTRSARARLEEAVRGIDEILKALEPERFLPNLADPSTSAASKESAIIEELMRLINTIDASSIRGLDERMRVNYVINGMSLFRISDPVQSKMEWCVDMLKRIKVAMTIT